MVKLILEIEVLELPERMALNSEEELIKMILASRKGIKKIREEWF